jgi:hypothetical protein
LPSSSAEADYTRESIEPPVLAWLTRREFARARRAPGFSIWGNHREFAAERDALYVGYGAAGLTARRQRVTFEAFEQWSRLTGAPVDIDGLDEFAAHWRWRVERPHAAVIGRFGEPGDPERNLIDAAGAQCLRIRPELYLRWRDDYQSATLLPAPTLDEYAAHVVECCLPSSARARRPSVSSS